MSAISRPVTYVTKVDFAQLDGYGIPDDGLGNLGDRYYDISTGRWYLKRWVGNLLNDTVTIPAVGPLDGTVGDWACELVYRGLGFITGTNELGIFKHVSVGGINHSRLQKTSANNLLTLTLRDNTGALAFQVSSGVTIIDDKFHKVFFGVSGETFFLKVDNDSLRRASCSGWNPIQATYIRSTDLDGSPADFVIQIVYCKMSNQNGQLYNLPYDDGEGNIVRDVSGNGNNGVVADGTPTTFWTSVWVPMDLL